MDGTTRKTYSAMRHASTCVLALVLGLLVLFPNGSSPLPVKAQPLRSLISPADDWPTYLHDTSRTGNSPDTLLTKNNASQLTKKWSYKTGGLIAASAAVTDGTVFIGSWDGNEYALDATTGALKWKTNLGTTTDTNCVGQPATLGITSSATVSGGVVYVGGGDNFWYALDENAGTVLWKINTGDNSAAGGHYNWASPLIYNGFAYVGISSNCDNPLVPGQLLQVSLTTHQIVNSVTFVPAGSTGGGVWTSPAIDTTTNTIFVTTGTKDSPAEPLGQAMVALDASSLAVKQAWTIPAADDVGDSDWGTSPILFADANGHPMVAGANKNGNVYAFARDNVNTPLWKVPFVMPGSCPQCGDGTVSSGTFGGGTLFMAGGTSSINAVGYAGIVEAFDPATGNVLWQHGAPGPVIPAIAYVNGMIIDEAGTVLEVLDATTGKRLFSYQLNVGLYGAPSIAYGTIFFGSLDGKVNAFMPASTTPPVDASCPTGWSCQDIGAPTLTGSEAVSGPTWTINAAGTGVAGNQDQMRFVAQNVSGDAQLTAQLNAQQAINNTAQAGLMLRQTNDPGSPYYAIVQHPNNSLSVQFRATFGGATTTTNTMPTGGLPTDLMLLRTGDTFQAANSPDGKQYTLIPGTDVSLPLPNTVLAGVIASSTNANTSSNATWSQVTLALPGITPTALLDTTPCPSSWNCSSIGNPALVGNQSLNGTQWTIAGAGSDIWNNSDQFNFIWQSVPGDGAVSAQVTSQTNTSTYAKGGVMLRQSVSTNAAYYAAYMTPSNGVTIQYRSLTNAAAHEATSYAATVPTYLRVARTGTAFSAYSSPDGITWTLVPNSTMAISMPGAILAGMAVTSHNTGTISAVGFSAVTLTGTAPLPCPSSWTCGDIGTPFPVGSQSINGTTWTVSGGGNDIWNSADQFHYIWQSLAGDGTLTARVATQTNSSPYAKAGVMLRQSTDPASANYAALVTPTHGILVQYRATAGAASQQLVALPGAPPAYVRIARSGTTYSTYSSTDGVTWQFVAGSSVTLSMTGAALAGIAVTSHLNGAASTVAIDAVSLTTTASTPPTICPGTWTCASIGTRPANGDQSLTGATWTIDSAGNDIWQTADQFQFVWQSLAGDGTLSAHVAAQTNTSPYAKAGVMLRQSADPGAAFYGAFATPGNGILIQYRAAAGASATQLTSVSGPAPAYVRITHVGTAFSAYSSPDGATWTLIPSATITLALNSPLLAGLAVTSHNVGVTNTSSFDAVRLSQSAPPITTCPTTWGCSNIGTNPATGDQSLNGTTWTVSSKGYDIWQTADQFHFFWQALPGDGAVVTHIVGQANSDPWAKAGIMLRQDTTPGALYYGVFVTPANGVVVQYRATTNGSAQMKISVNGIVPTYLKIGRVGTTFTAYTSSDGATWQPITGSSVTIAMSGSVLAGLAVAAHSTTAIGMATFDLVQVTQGTAAANVVPARAAVRKRPILTHRDGYRPQSQ